MAIRERGTPLHGLWPRPGLRLAQAGLASRGRGRRGFQRASRTDCLSPEFFTFSADRKQRERVTDAIESEARKQRRLVKGSAGV